MPQNKRKIFASLPLAVTLLTLSAASLLLEAGDNAPHVPSSVEWTAENIAAATRGDAFRGLLLARHCEHCHGEEGFSDKSSIPNLASLDRLSLWKQLQDFSVDKRTAMPMNEIAASLSQKDKSDLAAYYARLPIFYDPADKRAFPQASPDPVQKGVAWRLVTFGDGERGIPPCQACHGPVAFRPGAPSLATQNADYLLGQLEAFASGKRANDINEPMRTIARLLSPDEVQALAKYYGAGLGINPGATK